MNIQHKNNQPSFGSIKAIKYVGEFNPKINTSQANLIETLKKNKVLQDFFEKNDAMVEFNNYFANKKDYTEIYISYNNKNSLRNKFMQLLQQGDNIDTYKNSIRLLEKDYFTSWSADRLAQKIQELTTQTLDKLKK